MKELILGLVHDISYAILRKLLIDFSDYYWLEQDVQITPEEIDKYINLLKSIKANKLN